MRALPFALTLLATAVSDEDGGAGIRTTAAWLGCPCAASALCRPLSPQPQFAHESVAFLTDEALGGNGSEYDTLDYSKLSAVGNDLGSGVASGYWGHALCKAHSHNVRAIATFGAVGLWPPSVDTSGLDQTICRHCWYTNQTAVAAWVAYAARYLEQHGLDGGSA